MSATNTKPKTVDELKPQINEFLSNLNYLFESKELSFFELAHFVIEVDKELEKMMDQGQIKHYNMTVENGAINASIYLEPSPTVERVILKIDRYKNDVNY